MSLVMITSHIRGGGAVGGGAWVARITGPDAKWKLAREFCRKKKDTSGSGRSGSVDFFLDKPGVYELRGIGDFMGGSIARQSSQGGGWSGFILVTKEGKYEILGEQELSPTEVLKHVPKMEEA